MKKFILSIAIFLVLLLASAIFLPYLFKDKIIEAVKVEANKSLKANLDFNNNISINIFKSFPNLNLGFKDVAIIYNEGSFTNDTFMSADKIELSMDLVKFYKEQEYVIKTLNFVRPNIYFELKNDSTVNWDIAITTEEEDTASSIFNLEIESFKIEEGNFTYSDIQGNLLTQLRNINHTSFGTFNPSKLVLDASTNIEELLVDYDGIKYVNNWKITQKGNFDLNIENEIYGFPKNELTINGLPTTLDGDIRFVGDDMVFDITAASSTPDINRFLTLIPAIYTTDYASTKTKGESKLNFLFKGKYNDVSFPAFDLKLLVKNGWLKYPDLPLPAEDLQLDLHVYSKDGDVDKTVIDIPKLHFKLANDPFDLKLNLQDVFRNPLIDLSSRGAINLDNLTKIIPIEGTELAGRLAADLDIKGRSNAISNSEIDKFYASGKLQSNGLVYKTTEMPEKLEVSKAELIFNNQKVIIPAFIGKLGRNDIEVSAVLDNFFGYLINDQTLKGDVSLKSKYLNTNDFLAESSSTDSIEMTVVEIPGNINLDLNASITKLEYDDLTFSNFSGKLDVIDQAVQLRNIATDLLGGRLSLDGFYQYNPDVPKASFDVSYSNIKIADLFQKFKIIKAFAPLASQMQATTTAKLSFASDLNKDMSPKLSNVNLGGALNLENIQVGKLEVFQSINNKLGTQHFNIQKLNDLLLKFNIKDGKLFVDPFDMWIDASKLSLSGISKIDGSISYNGMLNVPASYIKNEASYLNNLTRGTAYESLSVNPNDYLNIAIDILGTVKKPEVKLNLKQIKQGVKQKVQDAVSTQVDETKTQLEDKAKAEADILKAEVDRKKAEAEAKLKAEVDKKKAEAEAKLKAEADAQKKKLDEEKAKLEEEAKKKLKGLLKKK